MDAVVECVRRQGETPNEWRKAVIGPRTKIKVEGISVIIIGREVCLVCQEKYMGGFILSS